MEREKFVQSACQSILMLGDLNYSSDVHEYVDYRGRLLTEKSKL